VFYDNNAWYFFHKLYNDYTPKSIKYSNIVFFSFIFTITIERFVSFLKKDTKQPGLKDYFLMFAWSIGCATLLLSLTFLSDVLFAWSVVLIAPFLLFTMFVGFYEGKNIISALSQSFTLLGNAFFSLWAMYFILFITAALFLFILLSPLWYFYIQFLNWNLLLSEDTQNFIETFIPCFMSIIGLSFITFFILNGIFIKYFSIKELSEANSLTEKIAQF
jgi:hypothetical protein